MQVITLRVGKLQTNCYLLANAGEAVVIDPGGDAQDILEALQQEQALLRQIVLTHGHADHVANAMELKRSTGAKVLVHAADEPYLEAVNDHMAMYLGLKEPVKADEYISNGDTLTLAGLAYKVISTPGHTPGSCCLYSVESKVLFSGDTLFASSIGRSDLAGGDPDALTESLRQLKELPDDTVVYPGHGPATTIGKERVRNRYW